MAALQKSKKSTCGTLQCPGDKVENEMSGVKALVEKVLVEVASLKDTLAGTMERPGLIHQVRELSESQRATAAAVEKLTEVVRDLESFKKSQIDANKVLLEGVRGSVKKDEVEKGAQVVKWVWTIGGAIFGAITGAVGLWASFKAGKP